jgi:3',5'-cyclic AMP phosphodiesterase CpdA
MAIHLGDMTNGGGYFDMPPSAFAPQLERLTQMWQGLPFPVHALPGNHDCPPRATSADAAAMALRNGHPSDAWQIFEGLWGLPQGIGRTVDLGVARLILVNTQGHSAAQVAAALPDDPVYGWVSDAEVARVEAALAEAGTRPVLVALHQLLQRWQAPRPWQEYYRVQNASRLLELFERSGNVRAVFQGHAHFYEVQPMQVAGRRCPFVICPAVIEAPLAWLLLTVDAQGLQVEFRRLPAGLPVAPAQEWRAGRTAWRSWRMQW